MYYWQEPHWPERVLWPKTAMHGVLSMTSCLGLARSERVRLCLAVESMRRGGGLPHCSMVHCQYVSSQHCSVPLAIYATPVSDCPVCDSHFLLRLVPV